jgi:hypothetical protein
MTLQGTCRLCNRFYYKFTLDILYITGNFCDSYAVGLWIFYICSLGYSRFKMILWIIASFLPTVNLFVLFYLIRKRRAFVNTVPLDAS